MNVWQNDDHVCDHILLEMGVCMYHILLIFAHFWYVSITHTCHAFMAKMHVTCMYHILGIKGGTP